MPLAADQVLVLFITKTTAILDGLVQMGPQNVFCHFSFLPPINHLICFKFDQPFHIHDVLDKLQRGTFGTK